MTRKPIPKNNEIPFLRTRGTSLAGVIDSSHLAQQDEFFRIRSVRQRSFDDINPQRNQGTRVYDSIAYAFEVALIIGSVLHITSKRYRVRGPKLLQIPPLCAYKLQLSFISEEFHTNPKR